MYLFDKALIALIYLLFPILSYLIYVAYIRNLDKNEKEIFLELALFSSLFLMIRYVDKTNYLYSMSLFNIPLLILYIKDKPYSALLYSILLVTYYKDTTNISILFIIVEYILYFAIYNIIIFKRKRKNNNSIINTFIAIKSYFLSLDTLLFIFHEKDIIFNSLFLLLIVLIFIICTYIILYFLNKCEEVVDLNSTLQELKKEKQLRDSMFKITHEVKNPLAVCKGYLQMIDYDNIDKLKRYIPIINDEINRSLDILNDFGDFGKIKINKEEVDLELLIEDTCNCLSSIFEDKNVITNFNFIDDEIYMNLDYNRIKQVLVNIFKNCIESHTNNNKRLEISLNMQRIKNEIKISITDNGCGMSKETLKRVDEMFYTTKDNGTGIGVALSKEIIERHNGKLLYNSILNKGTTATIILPI